MKLQIRVLALFIFLFGSLTVNAQTEKDGLTWYTDINQAQALSLKTHKPIFGFFTGSDWCGWCHKLEHDVIEKPEFQAWAKKNVILLELDFPRAKKLPDALVQQNNSLQQFFKVQGYPTVWIFNMQKNEAANNFNIIPLGSLGYPQAAAGKEVTAFLEKANGILKTKPEVKKS